MLLSVLTEARVLLLSGGEILPMSSVTSLLKPLISPSVSLCSVPMFSFFDEIFRGLLQGYVRVQEE